MYSHNHFLLFDLEAEDSEAEMFELGEFIIPPHWFWCVPYTLYNTSFCAEQGEMLQLSPAPGEKDYFFHLDEREGLSDLYDIASTS